MDRLVCKVSDTRLEIRYVDISRDGQRAGEPVRTSMVIPDIKRWLPHLQSMPLFGDVAVSFQKKISGINNELIRQAKHEIMVGSLDVNEFIETISNEHLIEGAWGTVGQNPHARFVADVYYQATITCSIISNVDYKQVQAGI